MQHLWSRLSLLLALLVLAIATSSAGTQVTLGQSTIGDVLFINTGPDSASFSFTGMCGAQSNCLSGYGYYGSNVGTYEMWVVGGPMTLGSPTSGVYPIDMSGATIYFTFSYGSSYLDGDLLLENVTDGTEMPRFIGGMDISSSNLPGFPNGRYVDFDGNIYLGSGPTLDQVYAGTAPSTRGFLSSGQFLPIPEPGSIALFGSGILGLAGLLKRKMMI
jgi:PEP-CTERM motif